MKKKQTHFNDDVDVTSCVRMVIIIIIIVQLIFVTQTSNARLGN